VHVLAVALVLLHGLVMRGPIQPVCRVGKPCSEPAAHVVLVFLGRSGVAARVRTDAHGRYAVRLAPGAYSVVASPRLRIGSGVRPGRFVLRGPRRLDFDIDTGIR
jgi:hypothetical protein